MKEHVLDQPHFRFKIDKDSQVLLFMPKGVFLPTGTTSALLKAVGGHVSNPGKVLDLGCGSGIVGIRLYQMGLVKPPLYASDLSRRAIDCMNKNATFYRCPVVAKCGSLFEPWEGEKFDCIVDDVSGIAVDVARISPWYNDVPCEAGVDGTSLVAEVLRQAPTYLRPGGLFFFPIVSFSNVDKILEVAHQNFSSVERLFHQEWPLPQEMYQHRLFLKKLQQDGHIQIAEKFGMTLWFTDVYVGYNS